MNIPQYSRIIEQEKETGKKCIEKNSQSRKKINKWKSYVSARLEGILEVIIYDPDINLADYDELSEIIRKAETEIWDYKI